MQREQVKLLCGASAFFVSAIAASGCFDFFSDDHRFLQEYPGTGGSTSSSSSTSTTIETGCMPREVMGPVRDDCGVFVSSSTGSDDNDGSQAKPLATIAKALASPKTGPVYLCAEAFDEAVHIGGGTTIYGGLDCTTDWKYLGGMKKSEISPGAGKVPLAIDPGVGVAIEDVAFRAKNAIEAGGSSIAIIATKDAELTLTRCDVEAGAAKDGAKGEEFGMSASAGAMGNAGAAACSDVFVVPGLSVTNACDAADVNDDSVSGLGGAGQEAKGGDGDSGLPDGAANGGKGEGAAVCANGTAGDSGIAGTSSNGAQGAGTISAQGYSGVAGKDGGKGAPGQGGGGGGGAKGGFDVMTKCGDKLKAGGASGGSGGSGGCGGQGGKGGQAGGASIGIVSLGAKLSFVKDVTITTKNGGNGGDGGIPQLGGMGGAGGPGGKKNMSMTGLKDGCTGGPGGAGGPGGKGGGGLGGHSIGIAHTGTAPAIEGATIMTGTPGEGGKGDGDMGNGAKGAAKDVMAF